MLLAALQLNQLDIHNNQVIGTLPDSWSSFTQVSTIISLYVLATHLSLCLHPTVISGSEEGFVRELLVKPLLHKLGGMPMLVFLARSEVLVLVLIMRVLVQHAVYMTTTTVVDVNWRFE